MVNVAVVGYGYWGPNLVRNFAETPGARVTMVCDSRPERLEPVRMRYPAVRVTTEYTEVLKSKDVDAVVVATPVSSHYPLASQALAAGKHVLVEKPLTGSVDEGKRLVEQADHVGKLLMVDHTFVYTSAVRKIYDLVRSGSLGDVYYYDSTRVNLGLFQHDVSVLWDLAVHDLAILDHVLPQSARAVSATGVSHVEGKPANVAYLTLFFDKSLIAHMHVNWLAPVKLRQTLIGGSKQMIVYDDLEPSEKIKIYDKGITLTEDDIYKARVGYRSGDMWAPKLDMSEALKVEATHFVQCVEGKAQPQVDGRAGLRVVEILEAATRSLEERGRLVELKLAKDNA